jgi:DNA-binding NtrC family response regulator
MSKINCLILEDDELTRFCLESQISKHSNVFVAATLERALEIIANQKIDLALLDLDIVRPLEGLKALEATVAKKIYSVVLTGRDDESIIREVYQRGAKDYLVKPAKEKTLEIILERFNRAKNKFNLEDLLREKFSTKNPKFIKELLQIQDCLISDQPILITGASGSGKTTLAKLIHEYSGKDLPFVHVNCAEFNDNLLESALFGHEKGSFTGATATSVGKIEMSNGGILFLDEIGTMSESMQKKLLKVIEDGTFYRLGGQMPMRSQFRLIAATCDDLDKMIEEGKFRKDLYFRVRAHAFKLMTLNERKDDMMMLISRMLKSGPRRVILADDVIDALKNYSWPGNFRELERTIELIKLKEAGFITLKDLPEEISGIVVDESVVVEPTPVNVEVVVDDLRFIEEHGLPAFIEKIEEKMVKHFYEANEQKVRKTIDVLKISNAAFYKYKDKLEVKSC